MRTDRQTGRYDETDSRFYNYTNVPKSPIYPFESYEVMCGSGFIRPRI